MNAPTVEASPVTDRVPTMTAADRCDKCGAQAFVRVEMNRGFSLMFCAHHFHENSEKLALVGQLIVDETYRLNEK